MNLGIISTPNTKGQIVIPKKYRDQLGINSDTPLNIVSQNQGIFIHLLKNTSVSSQKTQKDIFSDILDKTKGSWAKENWQEWEKTEKRKRKIELKASQKRQNQTW